MVGVNNAQLSETSNMNPFGKPIDLKVSTRTRITVIKPPILDNEALSSLSSSPFNSKSSSYIATTNDVVEDHLTEGLNQMVSDSPTSFSNPYAYVWVMTDVHENNQSYKGVLWSVLISAKILRKSGSTADFWLHVRLSSDSNLDAIQQEESKLLHDLGIKIRYMERRNNYYESEALFPQITHDKFLILDMTEYKRVIFLDTDTIPMTNLDYYFHLSDPEYKKVATVLKPFFIYATRKEPMGGGMFMVEPSKWIYQKYEEAVKTQREKAKVLPYPHFDRDTGWGYNFRENNDFWESMNKNSTNWHFYAAHNDQGLMYYVAKFLSKNGVSIAIGNKVQNWKGTEEGQEMKPVKESDSYDLLEKYQPPLIAYQFECDRRKMNLLVEAWDFEWACRPPYDSIAQFYGDRKPWRKKFKIEMLDRPVQTKVKKAASIMWFKELIALNEEHNMGIDFKNWNEKVLPIMRKKSFSIHDPSMLAHDIDSKISSMI